MKIPELLGLRLHHQKITNPESRPPRKVVEALVMPDYDEYGMSYKNRAALRPAALGKRVDLAFNRLVILDGQAAGSWQRTVKGESVVVETDLPVRFPRAKSRAMADAIERFRRFVGRSAGFGL